MKIYPIYNLGMEGRAGMAAIARSDKAPEDAQVCLNLECNSQKGAGSVDSSVSLNRISLIETK